MTRTIVRRTIEVEAMDPAGFMATEGHIWIAGRNSSTGNDDCRQGDGVIGRSSSPTCGRPRNRPGRSAIRTTAVASRHPPWRTSAAW
ncbi:hypothetical protein ACWC4E_12720 [Streptomyces sp. NPDC001273]|uniref:hypothetical protein n=1 Tax=unclassified Streptomyces TaxID=2593676 RepID=UPI0034086F51